MMGMQDISTVSKKAGDLKTWVQELELQVAMFIIQNNLPIAVADNLVDFIRNVSCDRTKCTAIIQNVIGKYSFEKIVSVLQGKFFSLIIDESTDIQTKKHLVLCARVADDDGVRDEFLGLQVINCDFFSLTPANKISACVFPRI